MNLDFTVIVDTLPYLWKGMQYTLQLTAMSAAGGLFFGTLLALARLSSIRLLSNVAAGYVNLMRSIPLVLVIFWFFFLVPLILQGLTGSERPAQIGAERTAIITFIMFEAAYFCEIMRAGIQSIPRGQVYSAYALGLNYGQARQAALRVAQARGAAEVFHDKPDSLQRERRQIPRPRAGKGQSLRRFPGNAGGVGDRAQEPGRGHTRRLRPAGLY